MCKKIVILVIILLGLSSTIVLGATKKEGIENFPQEYQAYLRELQNKYPNWKFIALYTDLDWTYVINQENVFCLLYTSRCV